MSKLYGLSEADLRVLKSIVSWYKAGGGGKSGRPTPTRRRPSAAASAAFGGGLYRVGQEITAANIDSESGHIILGKGMGYLYEHTSNAEGSQKWTKKTGETAVIYNIVPTIIAKDSFILTKVIDGEIFVDTEAC